MNNLSQEGGKKIRSGTGVEERGKQQRKNEELLDSQKGGKE